MTGFHGLIPGVGDGGFMMNSQEIETAVRLKLNLSILILNDNAFGMIKWKQTAMHFENWGLDYGNPDFINCAESYGAKGYRVEVARDMVPMLEACLDAPGVHIIEVPMDYSDNVRLLTTALQEKTCHL